MSVFASPAFDGHEKVVFAADPAAGLQAIIAVHSTVLGPAVGGCRMYPYTDGDQALQDVLRLSRGMTYKSALAGLPFGGGKSVIIGDPRQHKTSALLHAMGEAVESLGGLYVAAEDSGTAVTDLRRMAERTDYVSGIADTEHGGDPSPSTARGVFVAIRAALAHRLGSDSLAGARVMVQGLGNVGFHLAAMLTSAGARVYGADISAANRARAEDELGIISVPVEEALYFDVDVLAPCAMGGVLSSDSIGRLRAGIVAGAANNQLATDEDGSRLCDRGILYCPDFLINAGGIIDVHFQRSRRDRRELAANIDSIGERLREVLSRSDRDRRPTQLVAEELARERLDAPGLPVQPQLASVG